MKALFGLEVLGDICVIVAIDTQIALQSLGKCRMTFAAVLFNFSMTLNYLAWHDQCFDTGCRCIVTKAGKHN